MAKKDRVPKTKLKSTRVVVLPFAKLPPAGGEGRAARWCTLHAVIKKLVKSGSTSTRCQLLWPLQAGGAFFFGKSLEKKSTVVEQQMHLSDSIYVFTSCRFYTP